MAVKPRRAYNSPQRDKQTNATRRSILVAAHELFEADGFPAVTMAAIARQATISLPTVYLYFPGKAALVASLAEDVAASSDLSVEQVESEGHPVKSSGSPPASFVGSTSAPGSSRTFSVPPGEPTTACPRPAACGTSATWRPYEGRLPRSTTAVPCRATSLSTVLSTRSMRWPARTSTVSWCETVDGHPISTSDGCSDWPVGSSSTSPASRQ